MTDDYDDIINLPHHVSKSHPQMTMYQRAAQFAPFAALTGFDDRIREERRLTDGRPQLCEEDARIIDEQLHILTESKTPLPVRLTLFVPDGAKQGGALTDMEGVVRRVDAVARELIFADKTVLPIDNILALAILSGS